MSGPDRRSPCRRWATCRATRVGSGGDSGARTPLGGNASGGPSLRDGNSLGMGENDAIEHGAPTDTISGPGTPGSRGTLDGDGFGGTGGSLSDHVGDTPPRTKEGKGDVGNDGKVHAIVIPNGDGTSTVIGPDGSVQTVKGTPK